MDETIKPERDSASLYMMIAACAGIAAVLVVVCFVLFLRSSAYDTVKDIQKNAQINDSTLNGYDTISPVKTVDIDEIESSIDNQLKSLDNQADYSPEELSSSALGL